MLQPALHKGIIHPLRLPPPSTPVDGQSQGCKMSIVPSQDEVVYRFDVFRLDVERRLLTRGELTLPALRPKTFAVLAFLLQAPGRVHSRAELLDRLWPGVTVTDDSLTQCISELRRALGDRASRVLQTVPRRGYAVLAEVAVDPPTPPLPVWPAAAPAGRRDTMFVGPIASVGAASEGNALADALTTDLVAELARFEDLRVVRHGRRADPGAYRIRGEIRLFGKAWHVLIQLEEDGDAVVWSDRFDLASGQPLPVAAVAALAARIGVQVDRASLKRAHDKDRGGLTAREFCLLGRQLHQAGTKAGTYAAQEAFNSAVAADGAFGLAHAWLSFTVMRTVTHGWTTADHEDRVRSLRIARRGVELEPASPLCLSAFAFALALNERWDEAAEMARMSLHTGRPADYGTRLSCGEVLAAAGYPEEAASVVQAVYALDPHCPPRGRAVLGRALLLAGRPEEALVELRRCTAMQPDYAPCYRTLVVACIETGRRADARAALAELARLQPNWLPGRQPIRWFLRRVADIQRFERAFWQAGGGNGRVIKAS